MPDWLRIVLGLAPVAGAIIAVIAAWWSRQPRLVVELRQGHSGKVYVVEKRCEEDHVTFDVWLGNDGPTIARRVVAEAFLEDEYVACTHAVDVLPNSPLEKKGSISLRSPDQARVVLVERDGDHYLHTDFQGRHLRAVASARNTRRRTETAYHPARRRIRTRSTRPAGSLPSRLRRRLRL